MILVDIYVPAVDKTYDFMLDENVPLSALMLEITEMLAKKTGSGSVENHNDFVLYHAEKQTPLTTGRSLFESEVRDGDRLILV